MEQEQKINTQIYPEPTEEALTEAARIIREGGLVAFPTETVYGLGADALNADAAARIYRAKGRPSDNPLIVHLASPGEAERYCLVPALFYKLAASFMPGPLTVIMPKRDCVPRTTTGGLDSVAIRIPSHPVAHELLVRSGRPIAAPSANLSGKPSPTKFEHIEHDLVGRAELLLGGGDCTIGLESTIVRIDGDSELTLLRPGGITLEMLQKVCETVHVDPAVTEKFSGVPQAPGMKYRHYAPEAPLVILDGSDENVYAFLKDHKEDGILCYDEDAELLSYPHAFSFGPRDDQQKQAHTLFDRLRQMDNEPVSHIYARMPDRSGVGLAVFNRLIKAAGYEVIRL